MNKTLIGIEESEVSFKGGIQESSGGALYARQIHEGEYLNWLHKQYSTKPFISNYLSFCSFLQEHFQSYIFFPFEYNT